MNGRRRLELFVVVGLAYALGSQLASSWFGADGTSASFFPAAGVSLAALVLSRRREWWVVLGAVAMSELLVDLAHDISVIVALGYTVANTVQALVGASLVRAHRPTVDLARTGDLAAFVAYGVIVGPAVGGALGATVYVALDDGSAWLRFAGEWLVGDGLGVLVVAGAILATAAGAWRRGTQGRLTEAVVLIGAVGVSALAALRFELLALAYLPPVLLVVIALRVRTTGVAYAGALLAFVAAQATASGYRPWEAIDVSPASALVYLQVGLAVLITTSMALAAAIDEREQLAAASVEADAARRTALATSARTERLRALAQALNSALTVNEVEQTLRLQRASNEEGADPLLTAAADELGDQARRRAQVLQAELEARRLAERLGEAERTARQRTELLERHTARLAAAARAADVASATLDELARAGIDIAAVRVLDGGRIRVLATIGTPPPTGTADDATRLDEDRTISADAMRAGHPLEVTSAAELQARYPATAAVHRTAGTKVLVSFPLRAAGGSVIGALSAGSREEGWLDEDRRHLLTGVAEQCGLALERARLLEDAMAASERAAFLASYTADLDRPTTVTERAALAVDLLSRSLLHSAAIFLASRGPETVVAQAGRIREPWSRVRDEVKRALDATDGAILSSGATDGGAVVTLPLRARNQSLGALVVVGVEARPEELAFVRELGDRTALALANAQLYERERDASHTLQHALLGGPLPAVDALELSSRYRAGTTNLDVGGDLVDAFPLSGHRVALVVGDVVGHGLEAAVAMGQLRGAIRALAPTATPGEVLERLDTFVELVDAAAFATAAVVVLDLAAGTATYACAGHPPPLLVPTAGPPRLLWEGRTAPLGLRLPGGRREATIEIAPGELLVLYTDGLVERRGEALDAGLARLVGAAHDVLDRPLEEILDLLQSRLIGRQSADDDVCVLAARIPYRPAC